MDLWVLIRFFSDSKITITTQVTTSVVMWSSTAVMMSTSPHKASALYRLIFGFFGRNVFVSKKFRRILIYGCRRLGFLIHDIRLVACNDFDGKASS